MELMIRREPMKRKLQRPRHSFCAIWPTILFFKMIGLATFSVRYVVAKKKCTEITFAGSRLGTVYNYILIGLTIGANYFTVPYRYHLEYPNKTTMTTDIEIFQALMGSLVICVILLHHCIDQESFVKICNHLLNVEGEFRQQYLVPKRESVLPTLLVAYFFNGCLFVVLFCTEILAYHTSPIAWLTDIVPTVLVGWFLIQYFTVVSLLEASFVDVNRAMQCLSRNWPVESRSQSLYRTRRVFVSSSTIQPFLHFRDIHEHLCVVSYEVSQFYSVSVLFAISFIFLTLLYNAYYLIAPLVVDDEVLEYVPLVNTTCWIIFLLYPVLLLTNRVTKTLDETERTGGIVHALLTCAIDREAKSELKQFSLQLLHRKIKFSASGYFSLDNTLFHSIVGAVATYLVILIQFHMGSAHATSTSYGNCTLR